MTTQVHSPTQERLKSAMQARALLWTLQADGDDKDLSDAIDLLHDYIDTLKRSTTV